MSRHIWVARLQTSTKTALKINGLHNIAVSEVEDAIVCVSGLDFSWHVDAERGERAMIATNIRGRPVLIVLYDAEDPLGDVWNLGSVYFMDT